MSFRQQIIQNIREKIEKEKISNEKIWQELPQEKEPEKWKALFSFWTHSQGRLDAFLTLLNDLIVLDSLESTTEQIIKGLQSGEHYNHEVAREFDIEVYISEDYGPQACFNICGSIVTVTLKSIEQAAQLFLGFQGIAEITDVD